jgi:HK97 family phage portal protein
MITPGEDFPGLIPMPWAGWNGGWSTPRWNATTNGFYTEGLFSKVSTVFSCVDLLTRTLSMMPLRIYKAGIEVADRPRWTYDPAPGIYASMADMVDQMMLSLLLRGNTFLYSLNEYDTGYPRQMVVLDPDDIIIESPEGFPVYYAGPHKFPLEREHLLHIKYLSWPGEAWGVGPLDALARTVGIADSLEDYSYELADSGAIPWGVLTTPNEINKEQAEALKKRWLEASADRRGAPAILSGGMTLNPLSLKPTDLALLDLSQMTERKIAMTFGVQPFLLGIPIEGSSGMIQYANVTMVADLLWRMTLRPLAHTLSSAMSQWALPYGTTVQFDYNSFLQPDPKTTAETTEILLRNQVIDPDEARLMNNLPPRGAAPVTSEIDRSSAGSPGLVGWAQH